MAGGRGVYADPHPVVLASMERDARQLQLGVELVQLGQPPLPSLARHLSKKIGGSGGGQEGVTVRVSLVHDLAHLKIQKSLESSLSPPPYISTNNHSPVDARNRGVRRGPVGTLLRR
eukprot:5606285-Pyramimonas_sp.AAC.1